MKWGFQVLPALAQYVAGPGGFRVLAQVLEPLRIGRCQSPLAAEAFSLGSGCVDLSWSGLIRPCVGRQGREKRLFRLAELVHLLGCLGMPSLSSVGEFFPEGGPYLLGVALPCGDVAVA